MHHPRAAFTLIELLVVIAIISILAAIQFPVFAQAKRAAYGAVCLSNSRQLGMATMMYTEDNDGLLPGATDGGLGSGKTGGWAYYDTFGGPFDMKQGSIWPYVKNRDLFACPLDGTGKRNGLSFGINSCALDTTYQTDYGLSIGLPATAFANPSGMFLFGEETLIGGLFGSDTTNDGYLNIDVDFLTHRHNDGLILTMIDGHSKRVKTEAVGPRGYWSGGEPECIGHPRN